MDQDIKKEEKNINEKVIKNNDKSLTYDTKTTKSKKYPKQGDPNFSWHHHTTKGRQALNELDDIFGY